MLQEQEQRHIYYDRDLDIEAYNLSGIVQKFPNHFHEYYVIGFVEGGKGKRQTVGDAADRINHEGRSNRKIAKKGTAAGRTSYASSPFPYVFVQVLNYCIIS